jgi:uncharacterized protein with von Willebrand factor type A (vWA) domain
MQKILGDFIHSLRQAGLPISSAETLDALRSAQLVGIDDAVLLKHSLAATLSKSLVNQQIFEQTFDRFFAHLQNLEVDAEPEAQATDLQSQPQLPQQATQAPVSSETAAAALASPLAQQLLGNDISGLQMNIATAASGAGAQTMNALTQIPMVTFRIMQALGDGELAQQLSALGEDQNANAEIQLLRQRRTQLQQQVRDYVEQQFTLYSTNQPDGLRLRNLQRTNLTSVDKRNYKLIEQLVRKSAKRLASLHGRRRRVTKRGLLDVRRTIAANAAYDGFLFHTKWKTTRIERPKIMVICDVSGSVSRVARFLLLFLYCLQDVLPKVRSFVFSSDMAEVTDTLNRSDVEDALSEIMLRWGNQPTDYGKALKDFQASALNDIDQRTTVIMLGDARNNNNQSQVRIWEEIYRRSQRVIWLNPEGKFSWNSGDSIINEYAPYCSQVETCNNVRDLNRILSSLLKRAS